MAEDETAVTNFGPQVDHKDCLCSMYALDPLPDVTQRTAHNSLRQPLILE